MVIYLGFHKSVQITERLYVIGNLLTFEGLPTQNTQSASLSQAKPIIAWDMLAGSLTDSETGFLIGAIA